MPVDSRVISGLIRDSSRIVLTTCRYSRWEQALSSGLRHSRSVKLAKGIWIKVVSPKQDGGMSDLSPSAAMGFGVADSLSEVKGSKFVGQCK